MEPKPATKTSTFPNEFSNSTERREEEKERKWNFPCSSEKSYFPTLGCLVGCWWGRLERKHSERSERAEEESSRFIYTQYRSDTIVSQWFVVREPGSWMSAPGCIAISYWLTFRRITFSSLSCDGEKTVIVAMSENISIWFHGLILALSSERANGKSNTNPVTVSCVLHIQHVRFKCLTYLLI